MMHNELVDAWKEAAQEFNAGIIADCERRGCSIVYGKVPEELKPWEYAFLLRLYGRDEFDAICSGSDRHIAFARWACKSFASWQRAIERQYAAFLAGCENAAVSLPVNLPRAARAA